MVVAQPESWTHRAIQPEWAWEDKRLQVLADLWDVAALLLWARTKDGQRGRNRPAPYPRPQPKQTRGLDFAAVDEALARPRVAVEQKNPLTE